MSTYQITIREEHLPIIQALAAREGCPIEALLELLLEEKIAEMQGN